MALRTSTTNAGAQKNLFPKHAQLECVKDQNTLAAYTFCTAFKEWAHGGWLPKTFDTPD